MIAKHTSHHVNPDVRSHGRGARPQDSELPPVATPPTTEEVVPHVCEAGGMENVPEELLSASAQAADEIDHAGLDVELPNEDRAK